MVACSLVSLSIRYPYNDVHKRLIEGLPFFFFKAFSELNWLLSCMPFILTSFDIRPLACILISKSS